MNKYSQKKLFRKCKEIQLGKRSGFWVTEHLNYFSHCVGAFNPVKFDLSCKTHVISIYGSSLQNKRNNNNNKKVNNNNNNKSTQQQQQLQNHPQFKLGMQPVKWFNWITGTTQCELSFLSPIPPPPSFLQNDYLASWICKNLDPCRVREEWKMKQYKYQWI